jgi:hypothetical protein
MEQNTETDCAHMENLVMKFRKLTHYSLSFSMCEKNKHVFALLTVIPFLCSSQGTLPMMNISIKKAEQEARHSDTHL